MAMLLVALQNGWFTSNLYFFAFTCPDQIASQLNWSGSFILKTKTIINGLLRILWDYLYCGSIYPLFQCNFP